MPFTVYCLPILYTCFVYTFTKFKDHTFMIFNTFSSVCIRNDMQSNSALVMFETSYDKNGKKEMNKSNGTKCRTTMVME